MSIKHTIKSFIRLLSPLLVSKTSMPPVLAESTLEDYSPRPTGSCVGLNEVKPSVDLQIIIPAYNAGKFVSSCLESVVNQKTKYSFLATVINDGSTDETGEIIERFHEQYPDSTEVITQENKGFSGARNTGLKYLKGRYITFLDSDDAMEENAVENLMNVADSTGADIVQGNWTEFSDGGTRQCVVRQPSGFPWGKVYNAEVLEHFQFPEGYWFEDTPISFILYGMDYRVANTDSFVYRYRINPNGITATAGRSKRSIESYYITELCLNELPAFHVEYDQRAYEYFLRQCLMNWSRTMHQPRKVREAIFVLECGLRDKYFKDMCSEKNKNVETALRKKQFQKFEVLAWTR